MSVNLTFLRDGAARVHVEADAPGEWTWVYVDRSDDGVNYYLVTNGQGPPTYDGTTSSFEVDDHNLVIGGTNYYRVSFWNGPTPYGAQDETIEVPEQTSIEYRDDLSRVRFEAWTTEEHDRFLVERSVNLIRWETIRGGDQENDSLVFLDDYEFTANRPNYYRATFFDGNTQVDRTEPVEVTPELNDVWIKFPGAPFLNRRVRLIGWDEIERQSRFGVFDVSARRAPVVVSDVHTSRSTTIQVRTSTIGERDELDNSLSNGNVAYLHVPDGVAFPSMYFVPGDYSYRRPAMRSQASIFEIPIREVAKPGPGVYGSAGTWQTVLNTWASWEEVLVENDSWQDVASLIGSPDDVIAEMVV